MSNEPHPSSASLRLKPRLHAAEGSGASPAPREESGESGGGAAVQVAPPAATSTETAVATAEEPAPLKVRLRPKLQPAAAVAESAPSTAAAEPFAAQPAIPPVSDLSPGPAVKPPAPSPFLTDPNPAAPAAVVPPPPPSPVAPPTAPPAADLGDPGKFKLKPKGPGAPAAGSPSSPPLFLPADAPAPPQGIAPLPPAAARGAAGRSAALLVSDYAGRSGKPMSPMQVPHIKVEADVPVPEVDFAVPPARPGSWKKKVWVVAVLAAAVCGVYTVWPHLPAEFSVAGYTIRTKPGFTIAKAKAATPSSLPTPSEALNKLAQMPGNAIDKAQDALSARRASGQDRVDAAAVGEDLPAKTFGVPPAAPIKPATPPPKAPATTTSVTTVAPGLAATMPVEAAPEASPEFRAFVTNARISGIFQGNPARAVINGKLSRAGEVVDSGLGITFEGLDAGRKSLVFKDRSGATVSRRF